MSFEEVRCGCFWEKLPYCTRALGVATAVVLWGVGVDMVYHHHTLGAYIVVFSITLFFLEVTWVVTLFLTVCIRNENSRVFVWWGVVLWLDTWKKSLLYWTFAALLLVKPHTLWLTTVSGGMLIGLGFLHLLLVYKKKLAAKEALLEIKEDSYERYEEEGESTVPESANNNTDSDTASNHDYILQV